MADGLHPVALGATETGIRRAAVIGAGSMGAGIAAQFANAGIPVDLLDIAGKAGDRNAPAAAGIARQVKAGGFMAADGPDLVRIGNIEDDLARLADADWIVEAIIEDSAIKRDLYRRIETVRKRGTIVSSNTSTIPRAVLAQGLGESFARDFVITHFFNPPRVMRLVELVTASENSDDLTSRASAAAKAVLGKTVVMCRDTPGFIANRIGCYWIAVAMLEAMRLGLTVEEADAVNAAFGVPRTGVFALLDLIGVDIVPHVWGNLMAALAPDDGVHGFDLPAHPLIRSMITGGRHGRKTGEGFYRKTGNGGREALDLGTGEYRPEIPAAIPGGGRDLEALLASGDKFGTYAWSVLSRLIAYTAGNAPAIAADIEAIDTAVTLGYSWREGPFRIVDRVGARRLAGHMQALGVAVPELLGAAIAGGGFHTAEGALLTNGTGRCIPVSGSTLSAAPILVKSSAAKLRDLGDGVACFEMTTKMNCLAPEVFDVLDDVLSKAGRDYRALVLGNDDPRAFSAGADLSFILGMIESGDMDTLDRYISCGQALFLEMKYLPVPVVAAVHGFALGGGCEFMLHADAIIAHAELNAGLPETKVGLIPAWGGGTQLLLRAASNAGPNGPVARASIVFDAIGPGTVLTSAAQARQAGILRKTDGIVMHRDDLLPAAKARALSMARDYAAPEPALVTVAGPSGMLGLVAPVSAAAQASRLTPADERLSSVLASVLTGGPDGDPARPLLEADIMRLEREALLTLISFPETRARMDHMLKTGKPLRN